MAGGRPNWWVILAVSLALMALLVATASAPHSRLHAPSSAAHRRGVAPAHAPAHAPAGSSSGTAHGATASPTTTAPHVEVAGTSTPSPSLVSAENSVTNGSGASAGPSASGTTTTTAPAATPTTTPTTTAAAVPADRTQAQGYLDPPLTTNDVFAFTGAGATQLSVLWSGDFYLTMDVSCPDASQSVGGTDAMAATLPDAAGSCSATVSEPASESAAVTYTITIGPAGG